MSGLILCPGCVRMDKRKGSRAASPGLGLRVSERRLAPVLARLWRRAIANHASEVLKRRKSQNRSEGTKPRCAAEKPSRLLLGYFLLTNVLIYPFQDQVGKLKVVLVQHHHVTVAVDTKGWRPNHFSIAAGCIDLGMSALQLLKLANTPAGICSR